MGSSSHETPVVAGDEKQSNKESVECDQWTKEEWEQWKQWQESEKKWAVFKQLKDSAKKKFTQYFVLAVRPQWQFLFFASVALLSAKFPAVDKFVKWFIQFTEPMQSIIKSVLTVQATQLLWSTCAVLNSMRKNLVKTSITSQVAATRSNMDEWRQCLQFGAQWHDCGLQSAYRLWQRGSLSVPSPPANQWMVTSTGQPMLPSDYWQATASEKGAVTELLIRQLSMESKLTVYHEQCCHHRQQVKQLLGEFKQLAEDGEQLYFDWVKQYCQYHAADASYKAGQLESFESAIKELENRAVNLKSEGQSEEQSCKRQKVE